ncbi:MAG TPA: hypothetical protein EYG85_05110 [Crocinitomix sp.]|nr:hypothetical protein [Bacteroidia bacterium]HIP36213.1 hypothetical protein [Crocinitomix sp.]
MRNLIIYVNTNSTHHNIADFETYPFSSYQALVSNKFTKISKSDIIEMFDGVENLKYVLNNKIINMDLINEMIIEN